MNRSPGVQNGKTRLDSLRDVTIHSPSRRAGLEYSPGPAKWKLKRSLDELMPEFRRLYSASPNEHATLTNSGVGTIALDTTTYETMGRSLKLTMGDSIQFVYLDLAEPVKAMGSVRFRVRCKNWANVRELRINLYESSDHTGGFHEGRICQVTHDYFGARSYPWDNNEWRTVTMYANHFIAKNSPTPWGDTDANAEKTIGSIGFHLSPVLGSGENLEVWIDRIDSPVWPVSFVCIQGDAARGTFVEHVGQPFWDRGWNFSMSVNANSDHPDPDIALISRFREWASRVDMSVHGRQIDYPFGGLDGLNIGNDLDCEDGVRYWHQQMRKIVPEMKNPSQFLYAIWTDNGNYNGTDLAGTLSRAGVLASRGLMWDGTFKVPGLNAFHGPLNYKKCIDPVPSLGPYNYPTAQNNINSWDNDEPFLRQAARQRGLFTMYTHGVFADVSQFNMTIAYANAMIETLEELEDQIEFVTIRDLYYLTYGRPGDHYVDHRGEWKSRLNPTWIPS